MKHEYHEGPRAGENFKSLGYRCFSGQKDNCTGKGDKEGFAPQGFRQRQGIEQFLLPRPCLRSAHGIGAFARQLGIG